MHHLCNSSAGGIAKQKKARTEFAVYELLDALEEWSES